MINRNSKIFITGHKGLVGSAILRGLRLRGYKNLIYKNKSSLNLLDQKKVFSFLKKNKPDFIFIAAAKVGGILANNRFKAEFIFENLSIQNNLIHGAYINNIKNLIFLGSSCVYPKFCRQPIQEKYLMQGELEKTNDAYALAKIAGIKMCESYNLQYGMNYKCLMPTNTFGPNDNYDSLNSHFFPALIKKIHEAKIKNKKYLVLWGNGLAKREVIYVDDLADACIFFMKKKTKEVLLNIGTSKDYSIKQYVKIISKVIAPNKKFKIKFDNKKPNGTPRKILDTSLALKYGWKSKTRLERAIKTTYQNYIKEK
tara:strand:+ start:1364 stop:2299 length:936 start_codon:yes stop_codon:yes gene_type:complete